MELTDLPTGNAINPFEMTKLTFTCVHLLSNNRRNEAKSLCEKYLNMGYCNEDVHMLKGMLFVCDNYDMIIKDTIEDDISEDLQYARRLYKSGKSDHSIEYSGLKNFYNLGISLTAQLKHAIKRSDDV